MKAKFEVDGVPYPLTQVSIAKMDELLAGEQKDLSGFPMCFDERRRLWPQTSDVTVQWEG